MPLDWDSLREEDKNAFVDRPPEITVPAGTKIWKLTSAKPRYARSNTKALSAENPQSPWWSNRDPFDNQAGLKAVLSEAKMNLVRLITYVRNKSAVKIEWNGLKEYFEIELASDTPAFWGKIAPQRVTGEGDLYGGVSGKVVDGVYYPGVVGGWDDAYQLYIPDLTATKVKHWDYFPADEKAVIAHLGLS